MANAAREPACAVTRISRGSPNERERRRSHRSPSSRVVVSARFAKAKVRLSSIIEI
jgi:hypothetical protein